MSFIKKIDVNITESLSNANVKVSKTQNEKMSRNTVSVQNFRDFDSLANYSRASVKLTGEKYLKENLKNDLKNLLESGAISKSQYDMVFNDIEYFPDKAKKFIEYVQQGINPETARNISDIMRLSLCLSREDSIETKMLKKGATFECIDKVKEKFNLEQLSDFCNQYYRMDYTETSDGEVLLTATKTTNLKDSMQRFDIKTMDSKGKIGNSVIIQLSDDTVYCENSDSGRTVETKYSKTNFGKIYKNEFVYQIETICDKNKQPEYVLYTEPSKILKNAYEITKYKISDYQSKEDIIKAIKNSTIQGGEKISQVSKNGNEIVATQNIEYDDSKIKRVFEQTLSDSGDIISKKYNYTIKNGNGNLLLNLNKNWRKISPNTTITSVNDKKYIAKFDDDNFIIQVLNGNNIYEINIKDKLIGTDFYDDENITQEEAYKKFFELCKTTPADQLLILQYIPNIKLVEDYMAGISNDFTTLNVGLHCMPSLCHELGHVIDMGTLNKEGRKISEDTELQNIYNEEFEKFNEKSPQIIKDELEYFSPYHFFKTEDFKIEGINEFIAEVNLLMSSYCGIDDLSVRSLYLVQYFPKTIARIANLLNI